MESFVRSLRCRKRTSRGSTELSFAFQAPITTAARQSELRVVDRLMSIERARDRRQRIFKPCGAIEQHHAIIFRHASVGEALLVGGVGRSPLGTQQQALLA